MNVEHAMPDIWSICFDVLNMFDHSVPRTGVPLFGPAIVQTLYLFLSPINFLGADVVVQMEPRFGTARRHLPSCLPYRSTCRQEAAVDMLDSHTLTQSL